MSLKQLQRLDKIYLRIQQFSLPQWLVIDPAAFAILDEHERNQYLDTTEKTVQEAIKRMSSN